MNIGRFLLLLQKKFDHIMETYKKKIVLSIGSSLIKETNINNLVGES